MAETKPKASYQDSLKSMDTEEHIDLWFYRRIGYMWARLAAALGVTPNAITIASIFLGIAAGLAFYFPQMWVNVIGMLLLVWANSFDSADGQLARMTHQYSRLGRILDGMAGDTWFITIYIAICLRENATSPFFTDHPWVIWLIAALAGISHAKQASAADYYRQFHLYFLKGEGGSELENLASLRARLRAMPWKGHFWQKLTLTVYTHYTAQQEALTPDMQRLRRALAKHYPDTPLPQRLRDDFRALSLPLMKYTNILSFNWRVITLFISLFLRMPWIYFVAELVVFNAILIYMVLSHEHICKIMTARVNDNHYDN